MSEEQKKKKKKKKSVKKKAAAKRSRRRAFRIPPIVWRVLAGMLALALVAAVLFFLVVWRNGNQVTVGENAVGVMVTPAQGALSGAISDVRRFFTDFHSYSRAEKEIEELREENMRLKLELQNTSESMQDYERLQTIHNAAGTYSTLDPIYARVIAADAGQWFFTFTINKGESDGISAGMAVVNGDGLVGRVSRCGLNYAVVMSVIDSRSGIACLVQRTRDNCILRGGVESMDDVSRCMARYLPNINNIIPGDTLITSGTDSVYPKGLLVGTVTELSLSPGADGNYAVVTPAVDFKHIEEVLVLRTQVESADQHAVLLTPSPAPTPTPSPVPEATPTPDPMSEEGNWSRPSVITKEDGLIEQLPEDEWAES